MGGDCIGSHLVPLSTGYDFTKMVVEAAAGIPISLEPVSYTHLVEGNGGCQFIINSNQVAIHVV